jgi:hypothetical protein
VTDDVNNQLHVLALKVMSSGLCSHSWVPSFHSCYFGWFDTNPKDLTELGVRGPYLGAGG